jgi:hypothetical protein
MAIIDVTIYYQKEFIKKETNKINLFQKIRLRLEAGLGNLDPAVPEFGFVTGCL